MMKTVVRFAPAPTGLLSIADARMALLNWLFAVQAGGTFLLRLDDIVADRSAAEFAIGIERDLLWLGLEWGVFARQSERQNRHREAIEYLRAVGRVYACNDAGEPIDAESGCQWRFRVAAGETAWNDLLQGRQAVDTTGLDDPVVMREDGTVLRALSSVADDAELGVSHVIRDEDRLAETALQIQVFEALGAEAPAFGHLPPLTVEPAGIGPDGAGGPTVEQMRNAGIEAMALNTLLVGLGRGGEIVPRYELTELAEGFDLAAYGGPAPKFDAARLRAFNTDHLHAMPFEAAEKRLAKMKLESADAGFWRAVCPHLDYFAQVAEWHRVCFADVPTIIEDLDLVLAARDLAPPEPWDEGTWTSWVEAVVAKTCRAPAAIVRSLRLVLTGADNGPEMNVLLPMIGYVRALRRLGA